MARGSSRFLSRDDIRNCHHDVDVGVLGAKTVNDRTKDYLKGVTTLVSTVAEG